MPTILLILLVLMCTVAFISTYNRNNDVRNFRWDDMVLSDVIPKPKSLLGRISSNSRDRLSLSIYKILPTQYDKYARDCKEKGFTVDIEQLGSSFYAYNTEGYELKLYYYESENQMNIELNAPMQLESLEWPDSEYAILIPVP